MKRVSASRNTQLAICDSDCSAIVGQALPLALGTWGGRQECLPYKFDPTSAGLETSVCLSRRSGDRRFLFFATDIVRQIDRDAGLRLLLRSRN
jgi:hypothetical protein